jgi:serine protease inhibitor
MRKRISSILLAVTLAVLMAACESSGADVSAKDGADAKNLPGAQGLEAPVTFASMPVAFKAADSLKPAVGGALGAFSVDLFQRLAAEGSGRNVLVSPVSVWLALGMALNGASGTSEEGMRAALHAKGVSADDLNRDSAGLVGVLTAADPDVRLALANSVWIRDSFEPAVDQEYLERVRQYFASGVQALDFGKPSAADTINRWVEGNTNGNIRSMVEPPISADTVMFLINAVHFKAPWTVSFDPDKTRDGVFIASDGVGMQARYMSREKDNAGYFDEVMIAARLPYASGRLELVAAMPTEQKLAAFIAGLTAERLDEIADKCKDSGLPLLFPKFKTEYEAALNEALKAMGMADAFDPEKADFTAMSKKMGKQLFIGKVKHKSFIDVSEEGTEASAATSVTVEAGGMPMALEFNKPFVYWIRDTKTGAILFIGTLEKLE